jgi:hypothetical protein
LIPTIISIAALIVSGLSLWNSWQVGKAQKRLAEKTLKQLEIEEKERLKPKINYSEENQDSGGCWLIIENVGDVILSDFSVEAEILDNQGKGNIFINTYKFPLIFNIKDRLKFRITISQGGYRELKIICKGKYGNEQFIETSSRKFTNTSRY